MTYDDGLNLDQLALMAGRLAVSFGREQLHAAQEACQVEGQRRVQLQRHFLVEETHA